MPERESGEERSQPWPKRRRLDAAVEAFDPTRQDTIQELREAVAARVRFRRNLAEPPEAALIATKDALTAAVARRSVPLPREIVRTMIDNTVRWFVATYYSEPPKPPRGD